MRCIFCKCDSSASLSVEHIIPESLGNTDHILPRGTVCDRCNNYFGRKLEGPLLETPWFAHARSRQWIPSKRGLVPPMQGLVPGARLAANAWLDGRKLVLGGRNTAEQQSLETSILSGRASSVFIPLPQTIDETLMARFLAKVAIEVLAHRVMDVEGWQEELVANAQLYPIRRYARSGDRPSSWSFLQRRLYDENDTQAEGGLRYQVLHEFTLLYTEKLEFFAVVCLFGEEFTIFMGEPRIDGYLRWLSEHNQRSPLYVEDRLPTPL